MDRRFEIFVGNDIFSIGNYPDDYRTRQFVLALQINDRWSVVVDHSILTFEPPAESDAGCLDQLSGSIGAGWRSERLEIESGWFAGAESDSVDRPGLVGETGLRFSTVADSERLGLLLQVGLAGWLPSSDGHVEVGGETVRLQRPELIITSGLLLRFY